MERSWIMKLQQIDPPVKIFELQDKGHRTISSPARTAVPIQDSTPERKELNGKDPTIAICSQGMSGGDGAHDPFDSNSPGGGAGSLEKLSLSRYLFCRYFKAKGSKPSALTNCSHHCNECNVFVMNVRALVRPSHNVKVKAVQESRWWRSLWRREGKSPPSSVRKVVNSDEFKAINHEGTPYCTETIHEEKAIALLRQSAASSVQER
ncbi:hypothetical protein H5410_039816 [Solanum commersonii]|uniref:Uncharacterized protein n=1 Tax=Solanum commersonii TaxID=4109 RepID=A0A9J5XQQ5_SOLCO|nr:hypothetical protein H5410_039816 [Solanum commersonii]